MKFSRSSLLYAIPALFLSVLGLIYNLYGSVKLTGYANLEKTDRDYLSSGYFTKTAINVLWMFTAVTSLYLILSIMAIKSISTGDTDKAKWVIVYSILLYLAEVLASAIIF